MKVLGKGTFGKVLEVFDLLTATSKALKICHMDTEDATKNKFLHDMMKNEVEIQKNAIHKNIARLYTNFTFKDNDNKTYHGSVFDLYNEGDLRRMMNSEKEIAESTALRLIRGILEGLEYIHSEDQRVIHYDLKPENILLHKGTPAISDFGLSCKIPLGSVSLENPVQKGTFHYLPPEATDLSCKITTKIDIWASGVILFELLYSDRPFFREPEFHDPKAYFNKLKASTVFDLNLSFPTSRLVSESTKMLLVNLLHPEATKRFSAADALDWLKEHDSTH